jgi:nitrite reductase/ring-hydroxylating ferredoxin subunit|tara:strand:- start:314 stop:607 length:294 start_codon:yes stop_codon:yes gene_type:complete
MSKKYTIKLDKKLPFYEWIDTDKEVIVLEFNNKIEVIESICPHYGGKLQVNQNNPNELICPFHGLKFDITNCTSSNNIFKKIRKYKVISNKPFVVEG